jgi:hypothetical protein
MIEKTIRKILNEVGISRGSYVGPLQIGVRKFKDSQNGPFTKPVSKYDSPELEYDSYDGKLDTPKNKRKKIESQARKVTNYIKKHPSATSGDEDGNVINQFPNGKKKKGIVPIEENSTAISAGLYNGPMEIGLKKWKKQQLGPFQEFVNTKINNKNKQKTLKNNVKRVVGVWEKNPDGSYKQDEHDVHTMNEWIEVTDDLLIEDLGVWFGTKKKPKGSSQPKGPWVNICRRDKDGKHPPCGRPDTGKGGYPKCRAAGVAGKMSDSQKKSACQQKREAEKKDTQKGKGQKPVMTSYEPKKKKTLEESLSKIINRVLNTF